MPITRLVSAGARRSGAVVSLGRACARAAVIVTIAAVWVVGASPAPRQEGGSGSTHVGDVLGDLVHIKRNPSTGQPILQKREVLLPQDVLGWAYCPIPVDANGMEIPFLPQSCDPDPAYAASMVEVDYFGRLSGGRTQERNLRMHFDEAINGIKGAETVTLDDAGRLRIGSSCSTPGTCAVWRTIDSPMENLSIYRWLMKYGHLQTDPLEVDNAMGGDPAAGVQYHPALDSADWAKFLPPATALLPRSTSAECFTGEAFTAACAAPQALSAADFVLAGGLLAGAADKTGRITPDLVQYLNRIMKITLDTPGSLATVATLPALVRDELGQIAPATAGLPAPADERFVDFSPASYLRSDWFDRTIVALQPGGGGWMETPVDLLSWLTMINGPRPAPATELPAFLASSGDSLRTVQFLHEYEVPADLWALPAATITTVAPVVVEYSDTDRPVPLTATVVSGVATPVAGNVTFFVQTDMAVVVGTPVVAAVVNGTAAASYVLPGGLAAQTLEIVASFGPTGAFTASLGTASLTINPAAPSRVIGLSGNLDFGNMPVGSAPTRALTIGNSGNSTLTVTGLAYPTGFSGAWSGTIAPGGTHDVLVTFSPDAIADFGGTVTVTSDATSGTNTIAASGSGVSFVPGRPPLLYLDAGDSGDVFVYGPASGAWASLMTQPGGGFTQTSGAWAPGWSIWPAEFDNDGLSDLFLSDPATGKWFKMLNNGAGYGAQSTGVWWPGWQHFVLDLDGDGISDVFLYDPVTGQWFKCLSTANGFSYLSGSWSPGWEITPMNLNGDPMGDLFLIDRTTGYWYWALGQAGAGFAYTQAGVWAPDWAFIPDDFNGDGFGDLFLHRTDSGQSYVALNNGAGFTYVSGPGWEPGWTTTVVDLDADGSTDLFLYNKATGQWHQMLGDGAGHFADVATGSWEPGWDLYPTDFNMDGRTDLFLYNTTTGAWYQAWSYNIGQFGYFGGAGQSGMTVIVGRLMR